MSSFFPTENQPGIFSSNAWIDAWIEAWGNDPSVECVTGMSDISNKREIFYTYQHRVKSVLNIKTLFPAGISTPVAPSLRSEYFFSHTSTPNAYLHNALRYSWSQFFIPDIPFHSQWFQNLGDAASSCGLHLQILDKPLAYAVNLTEYSFEQYMSQLGANTRLKLFNKRKKLSQLGDVEIQNIWPDLPGFIDILNRFHSVRWGKPCYAGRNLQLISAFLHAIYDAGAKPDLSVIYLNGKPVSAVLDLFYKNRIYNIQSGYEQDFPSGISLGTLHFGFQLERAFASEALFYDFMAGQGKNSNYKASLATDSEELVSVMLVRKNWIKWLYKMNAAIKLGR